jgi:hypothetical protein
MAIKDLYVGIVLQEDSKEGIPAIIAHGIAVPLIASDNVDLARIEALAQKIADNNGKEITIAKFSIRENVKVIKPSFMNNGNGTVVFENKPICPSCGALLNAATDMTHLKNIPDTGDLSICVGCMAALRFVRQSENQFKLELLSAEELKALPKDAKDILNNYKTHIMELRSNSLAKLGSKLNG